MIFWRRSTVLNKIECLLLSPKTTGSSQLNIFTTAASSVYLTTPYHVRRTLQAFYPNPSCILIKDSFWICHIFLPCNVMIFWFTPYTWNEDALQTEHMLQSMLQRCNTLTTHTIPKKSHLKFIPFSLLKIIYHVVVWHLLGFVFVNVMNFNI